MQTSQEDKVLAHLKERGSITRVEAEAIYQIRHLPTRIFNLRAEGHVISSETRRDPNGQRYVRYRHEGFAPKGN